MLVVWMVVWSISVDCRGKILLDLLFFCFLFLFFLKEFGVRERFSWSEFRYPIKLGFGCFTGWFFLLLILTILRNYFLGLVVNPKEDTLSLFFVLPIFGRFFFWEGKGVLVSVVAIIGFGRVQSFSHEPFAFGDFLGRVSYLYRIQLWFYDCNRG